MTKTLKLKPAAKAKKDNVKANVEKTTKRITEKKDLKYTYPKDISTLEARKKFRGNARSKRDGFMKKIAKAETPKVATALKKEAKAWASEIFTKSAMPTF